MPQTQSNDIMELLPNLRSRVLGSTYKNTIYLTRLKIAGLAVPVPVIDIIPSKLVEGDKSKGWPLKPHEK